MIKAFAMVPSALGVATPAKFVVAERVQRIGSIASEHANLVVTRSNLVALPGRNAMPLAMHVMAEHAELGVTRDVWTEVCKVPIQPPITTIAWVGPTPRVRDTMAKVASN